MNRLFPAIKKKKNYNPWHFVIIILIIIILELILHQ